MGRCPPGPCGVSNAFALSPTCRQVVVVDERQTRPSPHILWSRMGDAVYSLTAEIYSGEVDSLDFIPSQVVASRINVLVQVQSEFGALATSWHSKRIFR